MLFVRLTTCLACLLLVGCADLVGVEDWSPMPAATQSLEAGIEAPDGTSASDGSSGDALSEEADAAPEAESGSLPCQEGDWRCMGATLERCTAGVWAQSEVCETSALCSSSAGACEEPVCAPGVHSCDGQRLLTCNAGRDGWAMKENCKQGFVCDAANARCAVCIAGSMACQGADLLRCTEDGQKMEVIQTCATGQICDASQGQCLTP